MADLSHCAKILLDIATDHSYSHTLEDGRIAAPSLEGCLGRSVDLSVIPLITCAPTAKTMKDIMKSKQALLDEVKELRGRIEELEGRIGKYMQTEKVLRNPTEAVRLMLENANDAIYVTQGDFIKFINPKAVEIFGYTAEEFMARPFIEFAHPDDHQIIYDRYRRRLNGETISDLYPHRIMDKEGNFKWVQVNSVLITWEGCPAILNFLMDISEKKTIEDALNQSERLLADIINFLPDATFAIDLEGKVIAWNHPIEELTSVDASVMVGKGGHE